MGVHCYIMVILHVHVHCTCGLVLIVCNGHAHRIEYILFHSSSDQANLFYLSLTLTHTPTVNCEKFVVNIFVVASQPKFHDVLPLMR